MCESLLSFPVLVYSPFTALHFRYFIYLLLQQHFASTYIPQIACFHMCMYVCICVFVYVIGSTSRCLRATEELASKSDITIYMRTAVCKMLQVANVEFKWQSTYVHNIGSRKECVFIAKDTR